MYSRNNCGNDLNSIYSAHLSVLVVFDPLPVGVLDFLQFPIDEERMKCVAQNNHVQYHRPVVNMTNPYTEEQQRKIEGWISKHKEQLAKLNISYTEWSW